MWRGKREPAVTVTKQDGNRWIGAGIGERDVRKPVAIEVRNHCWANCRNPALGDLDGSAESTFAIANKNLHLGKGDSKDIDMAVTIEICHPYRTRGTWQV